MLFIFALRFPTKLTVYTNENAKARNYLARYLSEISNEHGRRQMAQVCILYILSKPDVEAENGSKTRYIALGQIDKIGLRSICLSSLNLNKILSSCAYLPIKLCLELPKLRLEKETLKLQLEPLEIGLLSEFNALLPIQALMENFVDIAMKLLRNDFQVKPRKSQLEIIQKCLLKSFNNSSILAPTFMQNIIETTIKMSPFESQIKAQKLLLKLPIEISLNFPLDLPTKFQKLHCELLSEKFRERLHLSLLSKSIPRLPLISSTKIHIFVVKLLSHELQKLPLDLPLQLPPKLLLELPLQLPLEFPLEL